MLYLKRLWRAPTLAGLILLVAGILALNMAQMPARGQDNCQPANLNTANWTTDFCKSAVDFSEILVGHPVKDGIPAVSDPAMETVDEASAWLGARSPVIAIQIDGEARAYPLAILMWHEIANDEIAGTPVAVTFCPLCNSAVTFDRRVNGDLLDFGVSGLLRNSDLIMYDRQSETWWQQLTGEGLAGDYAGVLLDIVPSQVIGFHSFAERFPDGQVMSRDTGHYRQYGVNPYSNYDSRPGRPFLFRGEVDPRLDSAVDHVLAAIIGESAKAYPFEILQRDRVINDAIGETPIVIFFQSGAASALGDADINSARDIGAAGMYQSSIDDKVLRFAANDDGAFKDEETGSTWNAFGEAIAGELAGSQLNWVHAFPHFWFAWAAFHPDTDLYAES